MTDAPHEPPGFWRRLSRRTKIVIVVDLIVLVILAGAAAFYLVDAKSDSSSESAATPGTTTSAPVSPLRTPHGLAWIAATCGGSMTLQDLPNSPLPQAIDYAVCIAPETGAAVVIGAYDDEAALDDDVAGMRVPHRYATRVDEGGKYWLVMVEGDSAEPLQALQRYRFRIR